jgi:hypothetical protein
MLRQIGDAKKISPSNTAAAPKVFLRSPVPPKPEDDTLIFEVNFEIAALFRILL